ncbi:amino acid permease [Arsenicicoccus dermatophilus]|uniref:amino acid permease n=1 Tax=Arsenicicoccus dermatophilus TaxID=1076331 RepID=UPI001F4C644D|nr:amino acid permease [Arsenicicoccus dermatophilus]MCH8613324.1 amino acid permease [Arsenicicoccus dermatophilus]
MSTDNSHGRGIWRRKRVDQLTEDTEAGGLRRSIGLWQLTAIGVGGIIGAGIFTLAGTVASGAEGGLGVGPAVLISFLIAGVASAAAALSYAEFAGLIPQAGSAYTYGYAVLGEVVGWAIGWDLLLEYTAIVAVVAIGISGYFSYLLAQLHLTLPAWMMGAPGTGPGHRVDLFAMLLCLFTAYLLTRGMKNAARFETVVVALKVAIVLLVVVVGAFQIRTANYTPFAPAGLGGAMTGAATVFFAVFGYDAMSTAAEESVDARRHLPRAIIYSLAISMVLYVLACLVLTGIQSYTEIDPTAGFSAAFAHAGMSGLGTVVAVGAVVGILSVLFTFMLGVTRVWFAMSRDGLLPAWFAKTDPVRHVPARVTWIVGVASALIAGLMPIAEAAELTNIGILLAFVVVCFAVVRLRRTRPDLPRTFRCPWVPVVPLVGMAFSLWLITYLQWQTWVRFGVWFLVGMAIYLAYGRTHSVLARDDG